MYLSQITGNILQKFNNQPINIIYEPQHNLFDILVSELLDYNYYTNRFEHWRNIVDKTIYTITEETSSLFNYNLGITSNILQYASSKRFSALHLNAIIFTHSYRPQSIKKEDLVLLNNNLTREKKVFFTPESAKSWRLANSSAISYGIPTNKLYNEHQDRIDRVLILDVNKSPNIQALSSFMEKHGVHADIVTDMDFNLDNMRGLFNKYKVCVEFYEHNISNLLAAISCGCYGVTYATQMIAQDFGHTPNLYTARSVEDLINAIKELLNTANKQDNTTDHFDKYHNFDKFKSNMSNLIEQANNEAFI
jgi:hypothetical protein